MNERIRELAKQAGGEFWQRIESDGVLNPEAYITFDPPQSLEKFAELIVKECLAKCDKYAGGGAGSEWELGSLYSAEAIGDEIREHFGVE